MSLLSKPLKEMTKEEKSVAFGLYDAKIREVVEENKKFQRSVQKKIMVISDDLGLKGVLNHADGKIYDSKSEYSKAVRQKGCRIVGNDYNNVTMKTPLERGIRGDFNVRPQLKEAVQRVLG